MVCSAEFAARQPARSGFLGKIGNAELVRGVSDLYDLCREIDTPSVSVQRYGLLCQNTRRLFDSYHWLAGEQLAGLAPLLREIAATAELVDSYKDWSAHQTYLHIVSEHEAVDDAETMYRRAMAFAAAREPNEFRAELSDLRDQLRLVAERERFTIKNIL